MLHVRQRLQLYRSFCTLFRYPDAGLLQLQEEGGLADIALWLHLSPPGLPADDWTLDVLQEEYTGLFVARPGGIPAPLYGSVYLDDGQLMGESSLRVADHYQAQGLSLGDDGEPPDFLSTELEFLYYLVDREVEGLASRQLDRVQEMTRFQRDFISLLLLPWLESFSARLQNQGSVLYAWGAEALLVFVRQELSWLNKLP